MASLNRRSFLGLAGAGTAATVIAPKLHALGWAEQEAAKLKEFFIPGAKAEQVLNDIFWSLLNAKEFVFNH